MEGLPPAAATEPNAPRWGIGDALVGLLVGVLGANVAVGVLIGVTGRARLGTGEVLASQLGLWVGFIGWPLIVARRKGAGAVSDLGLQTRTRDIGAGVAVGLGFQVLVAPAVQLLMRAVLGVRIPEQELVRQAEHASTAGLVVFAVLAVVLAPLAEELFFRGLLLRSVARRWGDRPAIGLSSVAWAATHFIPAAVPVFVAFGVVLGLLTLRAGRLGPALWAHGAFNALAVVGIIAAR